MSTYPFVTGIRTRGVRANLALLVLGCILPIAAVAAFLVFHFYEHEQHQLSRNAISRARAMIAAVDRDFVGTQAALQALGTSYRLTHGDLRGFHARALEVLRDMHADSIVVVDTSGQLLLSTREPFGAPLPKLDSAALLKGILETGKPAVSELHGGPLAAHLTYTIAVPIQRDGSILFLLAGSAAPSQLGYVLSEQKLPNSWRASIADSTGSVVARTHDMESFLGKKINADLAQRISVSNEGGLQSRSLDGVPVLTVFSRSPLTKWTVALSMPLAELTAGLRQTLLWLIVATGAALGAGLGFAWLIGGNIARSISALIPPAMAIGSGTLLPIPPLHFKEANQLGRALVDAASRLHQAQAGLRESEQRLTLAADATHLGIWMRDVMRDEIWGSEQWRTLFGFSATQRIVLDSMLQRIHPDDRAMVRRTLAGTLQDTSTYDMEYRIEPPDAGLRWIGSRVKVESDAAGRPLLVRGVSFDITLRKQAELAVQQQQEEINHLSRLAMLGELSAALAHELNQPLTSILSNAQAAQRFLAKDKCDLNEVRDILQDIVDEDKRAGEVIWRLRQLFGNSATEHQSQSVDANEVVLDVVRILRNDLINHGVTLTTALAASAPVVRADRVQLQQVLINLLMNACDAMAQLAARERLIVVRTTVRTTLADDDASVQFSVIDQGVGIPVASLEQIFESFYTTKEQGMGLGLSICRNIVSANDGWLWAENNPDRGASLHLRLPLQPGPNPGQGPSP